MPEAPSTGMPTLETPGVSGSQAPLGTGDHGLPRPLKILTFTTLFPNSAQPHHAYFVQSRIRALAKLAELQVLAPVPWSPPVPGLPARFYRCRSVPSQERQGDLMVVHPRFATIPGALKSADPLLMAMQCAGTMRRLRGRFEFDLIDAHWACPDGVAAALLAAAAGVPFSVTVRGDDINVFAEERGRRQLIAWSLRRAACVIALSRDLADKVVALGSRPERVAVIPNGVDVDLFRPMDRGTVRDAFGISAGRRVLFSAGRLHRSKGFHTLVEALGRLGPEHADVDLVIAGGPDHEADATADIRETARRHGLETRVRLIGPVNQAEMVRWYNAADFFCLATEREGSANVLIEAQACGLPCVTTDVGGNREAVPDERSGILAAPDAGSMAAGLRRALALSFDRAELVRRASMRSWDVVARECLVSLEAAVVAGGDRR
jgi:teichuronic acid biosynthesis glycosyltransferase TuaC